MARLCLAQIEPYVPGTLSRRLHKTFFPENSAPYNYNHRTSVEHATKIVREALDKNGNKK